MKRKTRRKQVRRRDGAGGRRRWVAGGLVLLALLIGAVVYASVGRGGSGSEVPLPDFVARRAPPVQEAYVYAVQHPEVLSHMPCYCGCISVGHHSNADCFVDERLGDGTVRYDPHGST